MKVLLGVTGCIAAYKSCEILRALQTHGIDIEVVMTEHAQKFVGEQTFSALSGHPAKTTNFDDQEDPITHIRMAESCDLFLIAPCTANVLSKIACGIADDLLTTCALVAHDKMAIAPAMNVHMYEAPSTQENLRKLRSRGIEILDPESGYLACGDVGPGRLAKPEDIAKAVLELLERRSSVTQDLAGKKIVITAGPTRERIDPVRYITNDSSGKMGIALANAANSRGADVTLVLGPVSITPDNGVNVVSAITSDDMKNAVSDVFEDCDAAIFSAAVCDVKPSVEFDFKLKKGRDDKSLSLIKTEDAPDILKMFAERKEKRYVVGFAAETDNVVEGGKAKLASKGADLIVANEVGHGSTFGKDDSKAWLIDESGVIELDFMPKTELAEIILDEVCANMS